MELALIYNNELILGPIGYNVRMINSELEDLELEDRIGPRDYERIPIHFSDELTHIIPIEKNIPNHDNKYHNIGNFEWTIVEEDNIPIKLRLNYPIYDKTLEEVKELRRKEISPIRKEKEKGFISLTVSDVLIEVSTSREERILLTTKLTSSPGTHNYKFGNTWVQITEEQLKYIISEVDKFIQSLYDWEIDKNNEINLCQTIDDVYNVEII
jgi:hypothetical protein